MDECPIKFLGRLIIDGVSLLSGWGVFEMFFSVIIGAGFLVELDCIYNSNAWVEASHDFVS